MAIRSNNSSQRNSAWRSCRMLPSPWSWKPSCFRTALVPPSQPTRYFAVIVEVLAALADLRRDRLRVLPERQELAAVAHRHARQRLRHRFQQRLQRVLRDELIGLERQGAVMARRDLLLGVVDGRIGQVQQRRLDQRKNQEHVHRHPAPASPPRGFSRQARAAGRFPWSARCSAPSSATCAARFSARPACSARRAGRDRPPGQPDRPGADDENVGVHR